MDASPRRWPLSLRVAFRFAFAYFLLYCAPFPLTWIPYADRAGEWFNGFWHAVVPWVAAHVLRLPHPITVFENGSGDTTYNWVRLSGHIARRRIEVRLHRVDESKFLLLSRGFHWITEYPFNR
jgi:hypothetical protein